MNLIDTYLLYLVLQEKEWNSDDEHKDSFNVQNFADLISQKIDNKIFRQMRHSLQPSMYSIYIKNALGDYMGRPDSMNTQTFRHMGFKEFKRDLELLMKRAAVAQKEKPMFSKNFFPNTSPPIETSDYGEEFDGEEGDYGFEGSFSNGGEGNGDGGQPGGAQ